MTDPLGVNLLPASGEWVYDTIPHRTRQVTQTAPVIQNLNAAPGGTRTDYSIAIDNLQATYPGCRTVSLVCAWFGSSTDATQCKIYPSTIYIGGSSQALANGAWSDDPWRCSGLTQASSGLIPISRSGGSFVYGGTPSDPSIVRCLLDLKARGFRVVFYPFLLMDCPGYPWRGRITYQGTDVSQAASGAAASFLGTAATSQFTRDPTNLTVGYSGSATDYTYRRMILHYANLCAVAGGVDLFLVGSELRGLETLRGPSWTKAGTVGANGTASWDYPFVAGLTQLAADVRSVFDGAGLTRDLVGLHNLVAYSADWSDWMGYQHPGANGQWPHLDQLYASPAVDLVSLDNYMPLSDWTSTGGLDVACWNQPKPSAWPPGLDTMNGLGLGGPPTLASLAYLKGNIEGGEKYDWFYADSTNLGRGLDPAGSGATVSRPEGDRLGQARSPYAAGQQILANKQIRWWWNNPHYAVYDAGDGQGWVAHGPRTTWIAQSKSITFAEYGFPSCDRSTNQPNVFYDPKSSESFTPYWSVWDPAEGATYRPRRDDLQAALGRQAVVEYWTIDGNNATSAAGVKMIEPTFMSAWNWDARPFPTFPALQIWGDAADWATGTWIGGKGPGFPPVLPDPPPAPTAMPSFPALAGQGWSTTYRPLFTTQAAAHVSGREARAARVAAPLLEITLAFDVLSDAISADIETLAGFYAGREAGALPFLMPIAPELGLGTAIACRFAGDQLDLERFVATLVAVRALVVRSLKT